MSQQKFERLYILKQKATQHINQKKYSWAMVYLCDALKEFQKVVEQIEDADEMEKIIRDVKIPTHKNLSLCYLKQGNYSQCITQCKQVLQFEPNSVKILFRIGTAYMNSSNLPEAQKSLKRAFFLDPNEKQVMKALQRLQHMQNSKNSSQLKPATESRIALLTLLKFIFFWPFILMSFTYCKIFKKEEEKQKKV